MVNARQWLGPDGTRAVEDAVREVERATACEFVCAVASRSSTYSRVGTACTLVGAVLGFLCAALVASWSSEAGSWEVVNHVSTQWSLLGIILGFFAGWLIGQRLVPGWNLFYKPGDVETRVQTAAWTLFGHHKVSHTEHGVGVLVYLSLLERRLIVLADRGAYRVLGDDGLATLRDLGLARLKEDQRAEAMVVVLKGAAERLASTYPYHEADQNELADHVLFVHPFPRGM